MPKEQASERRARRITFIHATDHCSHALDRRGFCRPSATRKNVDYETAYGCPRKGRFGRGSLLERALSRAPIPCF